MKAITLYPEHAEAFALGIRTIETRPRRCTYRGRIVLHAGVRDPDSAVARRDPISRAVMDAIPHARPLTRGAVVASAVLTDCVPMVHKTQPRNFHCLVVSPDRLMLHGDPTEPGRWVDDQYPFGDFAPGRWALLLDDIAPTTQRCPACWGSGCEACGLRDHPAHSTHPWCDVCEGKGRCDPVPARGQQQAVPWEWTP